MHTYVILKKEINFKNFIRWDFLVNRYKLFCNISVESLFRNEIRTTFLRVSSVIHIISILFAMVSLIRANGSEGKKIEKKKDERKQTNFS